ncbi:haloacid dehalogenase-like hydrolase [Solitalea sp. MAHUQ-68]|uniref:Haloacid dehalogenase-like hydrolase n=1 Tax=Solitalea agri TaxID=2953739 RepID=A0A9X2F5B0_9SPHI|nr:HAD family hydrolase [Solitalea agri]MCO4294495.1 haloacid dehalogenase-like hydrolase [Solitalea agri]
MKILLKLQWILLLILPLQLLAQDPLPSWNEGQSKQAIINFVKNVTTEGSTDFVSVPERIATFDNDGTLWSEQPLYFQFLFAIDQIKVMAPKHPEWKANEPFKSILAGNLKGALAGGEKSLLAILVATHTGMTTDEFSASVKAWSDTARHPRFKKLYTECVFQPMLELLNYLRANGFKTFIVSGGNIDFMRVWAERVYGIPPEQVVGTSFKLKYQLVDGKPVLIRTQTIALLDDKEGKPVGIHDHIGRIPIAAFGNSDGDFQMLEYTTSAVGKRFGLIVHHDDAEREFAYDRQSKIGTLSKGLDEGPKRGWVIVSMKNDWKKIFSFE